MADGAILEDKNSKDFFNHPGTERAQQFLERVLTV
jgi:ABC-type polar amino acid transport system ATPase subunit